MSARIIQSAPTERAFTRDKSWQHPGRRRHIYGPLVPMDEPRRDPSARIFIALAILIASYFGGQELFHREAGPAQQAPAAIHGD